MASTRTQIYLTVEQRRRLDELARKEHRSLAELVRQAIDAYLADSAPPARTALEATFGAVPDLDVPSRQDWDRRG